MYDLSHEQKQKLTTVLMEYLNATDWKGLFELTGCEEFAQQHTQFYNDDSWEDENLGQDCIDVIEFILTEDRANLKIIWELPGAQTMISRKDEDLHREIEVLIEVEKFSEVAPNLSGSISSVSIETPEIFDTKESAYTALDHAENLLTTQGASSAYDLMHLALKSFLIQICISKSIAYIESDSITVLLSKINDYIKGQADIRNSKTLSMLRISDSNVNTINDLRNRHSTNDANEDLLTTADTKFAVCLARSVMTYIDELVG